MNTILIQDTLNWFIYNNSRIACSPLIRFPLVETNMIKENIKMISKNIEKELSYFSKRLYSLSNSLFVCNYDGASVNPYVFGQVFEILSFLIENDNINFWSLIHPRISEVSKSLYLDGHYANAAEDAFIEINTRVKGLFQILRPNDKVPDGDSAMTIVFSTKDPMVKFGENTSETGKNIQKGFMQMLAGAVSALRNPKAHANITISADDAMRRLMFASMLMFKIDEAVTYSNIRET